MQIKTLEKKISYTEVNRKDNTMMLGDKYGFNSRLR